MGTVTTLGITDPGLHDKVTQILNEGLCSRPANEPETISAYYTHRAVELEVVTDDSQQHYTLTISVNHTRIRNRDKVKISNDIRNQFLEVVAPGSRVTVQLVLT